MFDFIEIQYLKNGFLFPLLLYLIFQKRQTLHGSSDPDLVIEDSLSRDEMRKISGGCGSGGGCKDCLFSETLILILKNANEVPNYYLSKLNTA